MKYRSGSFVGWFSFGIFVVIAMCLAGGAVADPPSMINIRGQLLDAQGHALPGLRDFSVQFFDAGTGGAALGSVILGQTEVSIEGLFNITVTVPPQVILSPQAWYEVAVASGPEPAPLTGADLFPNRIKMESVPFSLESAEAAHVDVSAIGSGSVLDAEFGYLSGVTGSIQTQINAKANAADVYTKGEVDTSQAAQDLEIAVKANAADVYTKGEVDTSQAAQDLEITAKANAADVYTKGDVDTMQGVQDTAIAGKVAKAGDTMTGALNVNNSYVGIGQASAPSPATDKLYNVSGTLQWNGNPAYRFPWTTVTADTQMTANNGYIANGASVLTLSLPLSTAVNVGDTLRISGLGAGGWKIAQNASQSILTSTLQISGYDAWTPHGTNQQWVCGASSTDGTKLVACTSQASGRSIYTSTDSGVTWLRRLSALAISGVASSSDGTRLVACANGGYVFTSTNSGVSWTGHNPAGSAQTWVSCASSADGATLWAAWDTDLYVSTDLGATWTSKLGAWNGWGQMACSADGRTIAVCTTYDYGGGYYIHVSTDGGNTWNYRNGIVGMRWSDIALSADGTKIAACTDGGRIWTSSNTGATWTARDSIRAWKSIAMSADGTKMAAAVSNGQVYTSTDSGVTWTPQAASSSLDWSAVVSSSDGTKILGLPFGGQIQTSTDSGVTWTARVIIDTQNWWGVTSSADGTKLAACAGGQDSGNPGMIYTSTDSGVTWTARDSARQWIDVASSADGVKLAACVYGGQIYTSTDSGAAWTARDSARNWWSIASSTDGVRLFACDHNGGLLYTSTDSGATWTPHESARNWEGVASSANGYVLIACACPGYLYVSTDNGSTWTPRMTDATRGWFCVASSADGAKLAAGDGSGSVYTSTDMGVTWTAHASVQGIRSLACSDDGSVLLAGRAGGYIYSSFDSGMSWTTRAVYGSWRGMACSSDGMKALAGSQGGNLYTSTAFKTVTAAGTTGFISGSQNSALELQYIGNNTFVPLSHEGSLSAN